MTSAQTRAIREQQEHIASLAQQRTELHDLLLAVLAANDGFIRVPEGTVMAARRQAIVHESVNGWLHLMTDEVARRRAERPTGPIGRVKRILVGG